MIKKKVKIVSEKLWLFNDKRADFLTSKFWIPFHFAASFMLSYGLYAMLVIKPKIVVHITFPPTLMSVTN